MLHGHAATHVDLGYVCFSSIFLVLFFVLIVCVLNRRICNGATTNGEWCLNIFLDKMKQCDGRHENA